MKLSPVLLALALATPVLARDRDLWQVSRPDAGGALVVVLLLGGGLAATALLLRTKRSAAAPAEPPVGHDPIDRELAALTRARAQLDQELAREGQALRAAVAPLIEGPLAELDQRVTSLAAVGRSAAAATGEEEERRSSAELERIERALLEEDDPRAQALLLASRQELVEARATRAALARRARLVGLELARLRTTLEALPARLRQVAAAQLTGGDAAAETIAQGLLEAVHHSSAVLDDVARPAPTRVS